MKASKHPSHAAKSSRGSASRLKNIMLPVIAAVFIFVSALIVRNGTIAWFMASDSSVNSFSVARVSIQTLTPATGGVAVMNTGTIPVYVRARVTVNIKDGDGAIAGVTLPSQYSLSCEGWTLSGNYYYYSSALPASAQTTPIAATAISVPDGCTLSLELIPEALQTTPASRVDSSWPGHPQFN